MDVDPEDPLIPRSTSEGVTKIAVPRWMSRNRSRQWTAKEASRARFHRWRPDHWICVNIRKSPTLELAPSLTFSRIVMTSEARHLLHRHKSRSLAAFVMTTSEASPAPSSARLDASTHKALAATIVALFHSDRVQQHRQFVDLQAQAAAMVEHVGDFIEGLHQAQLHRGVLFRLAEGAAPARRPRGERLGMQKDTDRENCLAVRGHIEDELGGGSFGIAVERRPLADEVVLVNVAGLPGIGFDAADGHTWVATEEYSSPSAATAPSAARAEWPPPSPS